MAEALRDEQTIINNMIIEMQHPTAGTVRALGNPLHLSATPARVDRVPPRLGEHGEEVLAEIGYAPEQISRLREQGVLA